MNIVARTNGGYLIEASENEIQEILNAVIGQRPKSDEIKIGHKIPAIDYASTITKVKALSKHSSYEYMVRYFNEFSRHIEKLDSTLKQAESIEL